MVNCSLRPSDCRRPVIRDFIHITLQRIKPFIVIVLLFLAGHVSGQDTQEKSFGERQLAQLLDDRPEMKSILPSDDTICRWVIRKFNTGISCMARYTR